MQNNYISSGILLTVCLLTFSTAKLVADEADFIAFSTSGCAPLAIQFYDQSSGQPAEWLWSFPGGTPATSMEEDPEISYQMPGSFDVSLRVVIGGDTMEVTKTDYITITENTAIPAFSFQNNARTVTFTNSSQYAEQYVWEFGDGQFSTDPHPQHTYAEDGVYIVKLKVTNSCGSQSRSDVLVLDCCGQPVSYTANEQVIPYPDGFRPGVNLGYFPPWNDSQLADIAAGNPALGVPGAGAKAVRPALHEVFLEQWGYDIRIAEYEHFGSIGLKDNTAIVGFPADIHRDTTHYCTEEQSEMFANLYTDIWDNGENGTPVNDDNYLALYLYKVVNLYKDHVTFWEIWNEPGFDYTFITGYLPPGEENNWWENDPDPCDYKLRAPIYHYVRSLRIAWEVIKYIDPEAYVTLASVGYTSFLDAVLRNTDNPDSGAVVSTYPLGGGAYFDAIAIHSYPHFDGTLRYWDDQIQDFVYSRHSDMAAEGIELTKDTFQSILGQYGYDGQQFPKKEYIVTEINVPRKRFLDYLGSDTVQVNFIIKAYVEAVINEIRQIHVYDLAETFYYDDAVNEFQLMGLYQRLYETWPYQEQINDIGIAYKTASDLFFGSVYDPDRSALMAPPPGIRAEAFLDHNGHYTYVVWVETTEDLNEIASGSYTFPAAMGIGQLLRREWRHSYFPNDSLIGSTGIELTATPVFFTDTTNVFPIAPKAGFEVGGVSGCIPLTVQFEDASTTNAEQWLWTFEGGTPASSTQAKPAVVYEQAGTYDVRLEVSNASGSDVYEVKDLVVVNDTLPHSAFDLTINENVVSFSNFSANASSYLWDFGDTNDGTEANPTHTYPSNGGIYEILLIAINACGTDTSSRSIIINGDDIAPIPDFTSDVQQGCVPLTVQFHDQSTANAVDWWWTFEGGEPAFSAEQNPTVVFEEAGTYFVSLKAFNGSGQGATAFKAEYIVVDSFVLPTANFAAHVNDGLVSFENRSADASQYYWDFGDGNENFSESPMHQYSSNGEFEVLLIAENSCGRDSITKTIQIAAPALAYFEADTTTGCAPFELQFADASSFQPTEWLWIASGPAPDTAYVQHPQLQFVQPGVYSIQLIAGNAYGSTTYLLEDIVIVEAAPEADFSYAQNGPMVQFTNLSSNAGQVLWLFGDGTASSEADPVYEYPGAGIYEVQLIVSNSCGRDTASQQIEVELSSVSQASLGSKVLLFPNPTTGQLQLLIEEAPAGGVALELSNLLGQSVWKQQLGGQPGRLLAKLDLSHLPSGAYLMHIGVGGDLVVYRRVVVQR